VLLWHIQGFPAMPGQKFGPAWFPGLIAIGLGACGALLIRSGLRARGALAALPEWIHRPQPRQAVAAMLAGLVFYILLPHRLGFHLTGMLVLLLWVRVLGASWRVAAGVAVVATLAIHLAFYKALRVPLPWGLFERFAF